MDVTKELENESSTLDYVYSTIIPAILSGTGEIPDPRDPPKLPNNLV